MAKDNKETEEPKGRSQKGSKKIITRKVCYNCGKPVSSEDTSCPHCGAGPSSFNPAVLLRIAIGVLLGFIIWLLFFAS